MANLMNFCRVATTFSVNGEFDEDAFRQYLQRFIDTNTGVYLGSGGIGEGHTLTWEELRRVYRVGVEACKGKVPVYANVLEQLTALDVIKYAQLAVESGVEAVNFYAAEGRHEFKPTDTELTIWLDTVLSAIKHPTALAAHPDVVYLNWQGVLAPAGTPPEIVARLQKEIAAVLAEADVKEFLTGIGAAPVASKPTDFEAMLRADYVANQKVVSKLKLKVD
jgi:hypothetical protein